MAFLDKLNALVREVGDKTTDGVKIGKLNMKINEENSAITKLMHQIGELYFAAWSCQRGPGEAIERLCQEAAGRRQNIDQLRAEIMAIKCAGTCPSCGAEVSREAAFCSACGHALKMKKEAPAPEAAAEPAGEAETVTEEEAAEPAGAAETVTEEAAEEPETAVEPEIAVEMEAEEKPDEEA